MRKTAPKRGKQLKFAAKVYSGGLQNRATKKMLLAANEYKRAWKP